MYKYIIKDLLIYILYNICLLTIAYFLNRFYQMLIFVLCYELIQGGFKYRFHADSIEKNPIKAVRLCKLITICVEVIYLFICNNLDISVYSNLLVIFLIAFLNCLLEFSLEYYISRTNCLRDKDTLLELCKNRNLSERATNRMIMKYIDGKTYQEIADIEVVDLEAIKKSINRSRKKIFENQD
ncbi:MAG: hypothetical protein IKF82_01200 [Bacilli bacterium]|nr:hypothetical protein [Bacilli bacterium]